MSYIIMVAAMKYNEADGISKKICLQAKALSQNKDSADLFCLGETGIVKISYCDGMLETREEIIRYKKQVFEESVSDAIRCISLLLSTVKKQMKEKQPSMIYIRHMIPQINLISVLHYAKRNMIRIAYEIPTYPYYREQINISHNKFKTIIKLALESFFWPLIYISVDRICVMCCSSRAHIFKKMISIRNGFSGVKQQYNVRDTKNLVMIGVGTIYSYHGYDRIIDAMKKCNCRLHFGGSIYFHIVGKSDEINRLIDRVKDFEIEENVIFHGVQYGADLQRLYMQSNLGVGTLSLRLRNANIDTAIKNIEYMSYYLPVISSGRIFDVNETTGLYYVLPENEAIDFNEIMKYVSDYYKSIDLQKKVDNELKAFSWKEIMLSIKQNVLGYSNMMSVL